MYFFLAILWSILGFVLAIPYCWLAGGGGNFFPTAVLFGPPVALFLFIAYAVNKRTSTGKDRKWGFAFFWGLIVFFNLPIILRFVSVGLRALDFSVTADFIFKYRYESIPVVLLVVLLTLIWRGLIQELIRLTKKPITK